MSPAARASLRRPRPRSRPASASRSGIVTLLTDFGTQDSFVAEVKGRMLSQVPRLTLVDISQAVPPFDILAGALVLGTAYAAFPRGTVHLAVVDPGVGSARRAVVLQASGHFFVGPDNGLFSLPVKDDPDYRAWEIRTPAAGISPTFHGRDVFAPAAAAVAAGLAPARLGPRLAKITLLPDLEPTQISGRHWQGRIIRADRFGNLETNFPAAILGTARRFELTVGRFKIRRLCRTFSTGQRHEPAAVINSQGRLEIFVPRGSAACLMRSGAGARARLKIFAS